jgi:hypothetical protein
MRWKNWNAEDTDIERTKGLRLHDAYAIMKQMVVNAWPAADARAPTFKRRFDEADADNVKNVLGRIMDMSLPVPEALPQMKDRVLYRDDFGGQYDPRTYTYTTRKSGTHHFCDRDLTQPDIATIT